MCSPQRLLLLLGRVCSSEKGLLAGEARRGGRGGAERDSWLAQRLARSGGSLPGALPGTLLPPPAPGHAGPAPPRLPPPGAPAARHSATRPAELHAPAPSRHGRPGRPLSRAALRGACMAWRPWASCSPGRCMRASRSRWAFRGCFVGTGVLRARIGPYGAYKRLGRGAGVRHPVQRSRGGIVVRHVHFLHHLRRSI